MTDIAIKQLEDAISATGEDWKTNPYFHGMVNGMIFARSLLKDIEPEYMTTQEKFSMSEINGILEEAICSGNFERIKEISLLAGDHIPEVPCVPTSVLQNKRISTMTEIFKRATNMGENCVQLTQAFEYLDCDREQHRVKIEELFADYFRWLCNCIIVIYETFVNFGVDADIIIDIILEENKTIQQSFRPDLSGKMQIPQKKFDEINKRTVARIVEAIHAEKISVK